MSIERYCERILGYVPRSNKELRAVEKTFNYQIWKLSEYFRKLGECVIKLLLGE